MQGAAAPGIPHSRGDLFRRERSNVASGILSAAGARLTPDTKAAIATASLKLRIMPKSP
jgi:hypothetical protein